MTKKTGADGDEVPTRVDPNTGRSVPRPFSMPWGDGLVVEEASVVGEYNEPTIQLLRYHGGGESIRFASYNGGRFQRSPLMLSPDNLAGLRASLQETPRLRELLSELVGA